MLLSKLLSFYFTIQFVKIVRSLCPIILSIYLFSRFVVHSLDRQLAHLLDIVRTLARKSFHLNVSPFIHMSFHYTFDCFLICPSIYTPARSLICLSNYASTARSFIFFHLYVNRLLECKLSIIQYAQMSVLPECLLILSLGGPSSRSGNSTGRIISNLFIRPSL